MEFTTKKKDGVIIIGIKGKLDAASADSFKQNFDAVIQDGKNFVFDMSGVDFIDSTGLGRIVASLRGISEKSGDLKLAGIRSDVMIVFQITRAYRIFDIYDDVNTAVESFE
jgi:anti-sigma B factor antagonist